jgi:hypothetical protein
MEAISAGMGLIDIIAAVMLIIGFGLSSFAMIIAGILILKGIISFA